jgi:hypothetical protein
MYITTMKPLLVTMFTLADFPAVYDGATSAVILIGVKTQVSDVYGIKKDSQFVNTLEDNIIQRGAPNKLISGHGQSLVSHKVAEILHNLCINKWTMPAASESYLTTLPDQQ